MAITATDSCLGYLQNEADSESCESAVTTAIANSLLRLFILSTVFDFDSDSCLSAVTMAIANCLLRLYSLSTVKDGQ